MDEHGGALNYDLMTLAGTTLAAVPATLGWADFRDFVSHLPPDSAFARESHPEFSGWGTQLHAEAMTADLIDAVNGLHYALARVFSKKGSNAKKPKPYPRPWLEKETKRIGSGAIPVADFDDWWESQ